MRFCLPLVALLATSFSALAETATPQLPAGTISAQDPSTVVNALQTLGYRAVLEKDDTGDPVIRTTVAGLNTSIYFYGCASGADCYEIQFSVFLDLNDPVPPEKANRWNLDKVVGNAAVDENGDVQLRYFVVTVGGMQQATFERVMFRWEQALDDFKDHINW